MAEGGAGSRMVVVVLAAVFVAGGLAVVLIVLAGDGGSGSASGSALYADQCARCHGAEGQGGQGPALAGGALVEEYPDVQDQVDVVADGRDRMPAFGARLSDEQIRAVVDYTRQELS